MRKGKNMKRIVLFVCVVVMAFSTSSAQKKLTILHTNDSHSCILPLNKNLADTAIAGRGGYIRRIEVLKRERKADPSLLLFDSGDFSQGSPFYTLFKGDVEVGLMNMMGYDAATIGNHEFDFGLENMARIFKMAKFPIVCANYDFTGTPVEGIVKPYTIVKRNGLKIGVFGVCPQIDGLVDETKCQGVKFSDPVAVADSIATFLKKKEKCDLVVCLSHLGWGIMAPQKGDEQLIAGSHDIDIVLGGHSHSYFKTLKYVKNADGKEIPDDQNGKHAVYVGKIKLELSKKK